MNLLNSASPRRLVLILLLASLAFLGATTATLAQEPSSRAGLIIEYGNGDVDALCIELARDGMTGIDLLQASGLAVGMHSGGLGTQVCQIEDVGCEPGREACWCQCLSNPCSYWTYFQWKDGDWTYAPLGASRRTLTNGDVDAWVWGDGKTLPVSSPDLACAAQDAPTSQAVGTPAAAPVASATVIPATEEPSAAPLATSAPEESVSRPGFGCSSPALVLLPLAALALVALWRR